MARPAVGGSASPHGRIEPPRAARGAQSRQGCPEEAQGPSSGPAEGGRLTRRAHRTDPVAQAPVEPRVDGHPPAEGTAASSTARTRHAHCAYTACTLRAHCMHTARTLHVLCMYTACALGVVAPALADADRKERRQVVGAGDGVQAAGEDAAEAHREQLRVPRNRNRARLPRSGKPRRRQAVRGCSPQPRRETQVRKAARGRDARGEQQQLEPGVAVSHRTPWLHAAWLAGELRCSP